MSDVNDAQFWQDLYETDNSPWDMGHETPVFTRLAESGQFAAGKMIVLGAGSGYDAHLFARHGFEVTAVDFAETAVNKMKALEDPHYPITIIQGDIFELPDSLTHQFDYILEYTCYCAIHPSRRDDYAALAYRLLKSDGRWIALSFPIGNREGGPPYVVQPDQVAERMIEHGFTLLHREMPDDSVARRVGIEELLIMSRNRL
ncbi:MAG: methyltransferase domain-containing protein [Chloroflexota bacterium]